MDFYIGGFAGCALGSQPRNAEVGLQEQAENGVKDVHFI